MTGSTPGISTMTEPSIPGRSTSPTSSKSAPTAKRGTRANKADKGTRLLEHGRLTVTKVDGDRVVAECKGDSGEVYELGFDNGHWFCSCLARTDCSHLSALWRVTVRPK